MRRENSRETPRGRRGRRRARRLTRGSGRRSISTSGTAISPSSPAPDPAPEAASGSDRAEGPPDRRGLPTPLILHLGAAAASYAHAIALSPLGDDPRFPWTDEVAADGLDAARALNEEAGAEAPLAVARAAAPG